jgi:predicted RNA-binding protein
MTERLTAGEDYHPWTTFIYARQEARRRGDRKVGTEHLVLALMREPGIAVRPSLRAVVEGRMRLTPAAANALRRADRQLRTGARYRPSASCWSCWS